MFTNLWIGYNATEDFRILICALDKIEAHELADEYRLDSHLDGKFEIIELTTEDRIDDIRFDCDYVIA